MLIDRLAYRQIFFNVLKIAENKNKFIVNYEKKFPRINNISNTIFLREKKSKCPCLSNKIHAFKMCPRDRTDFYRFAKNLFF